MSIFNVTTEGDCEGRSTRQLGYVQAESASHAAKYLFSLGITPYYEYRVEEVGNPLRVATDPSTLNHLEAKCEPAWCHGVTRITVRTTKEAEARRIQEIRDKVAASGLTKQEIEEYLQGNL